MRKFTVYLRIPMPTEVVVFTGEHEWSVGETYLEFESSEENEVDYYFSLADVVRFTVGPG